MAKIFDEIGIYGISTEQEILILQSLLTGDPLLMIGKHGAAKTALAKAMSVALDLPFQAYDASKAMFEDMIGFPSPKAMQEGRVEYLPSPITVWDKKFIFVDEVNRALPENQSKWLELLRSRHIMGLPLDVTFIWGAMNPMGYEGANLMDEAYVGRFATFVYVPSAIDMEHQDRVRVINAVGVDDCPAMGFWSESKEAEGKEAWAAGIKKTGPKLRALLKAAQKQYEILNESPELQGVTEFLSRFCKALYSTLDSTNRDDKELGSGELDGRRLGMMRRALIATKAMHIAYAQVFSTKLMSFESIASSIVKATIPAGVNCEGGVNETIDAHIDTVFTQLCDFFSKKNNLKMVELAYELMVSDDVMRKAEILIHEDLKEITKNSAWTRIIESSNRNDISILSLLCLSLELESPGQIPSNVIDQMQRSIDSNLVYPEVPTLQGSWIDKSELFQSIYDSTETYLDKTLVCHELKQIISSGKVEEDYVVKERITKKLKSFRNLYKRTENNEIPSSKDLQKAALTDPAHLGV